jgi:hypothetical protein
MTKENTKSWNKIGNGTDSKWRNTKRGEEEQLELGKRENDRNRRSYKQKQHWEMGERGRERGRMWSFFSSRTLDS